MEWSDEQKKAIYKTGCSILVNAGAGSGKTAVLTERLLQKILNGEHLRNLIVLTFSVQAAIEMKERLREKLSASSSLNAKKELAYIDQANIQTFDAFTNQIVKKYHYLLNIPPKLNIVGSEDFHLIMKKMLNSIFEKYYQEDNKKFIKMIKTFTIKDDQALIDSLLKIYEKMRLNANYQYELNNYDCSLSDDFIHSLLDEMMQNLKLILNDMDHILNDLKGYISDKRFENHYKKLLELEKILHESHNYNDLLCIKEFKLPTLPVSKDDEQNIYKELFYLYKELWQNILDILIFDDEADAFNSIKSNEDNVKIIYDILKELDEEIKIYKFSHNAYDFTDIQLMAIKIFEEHPEVCTEYKNNTTEILIDEYQDTSDLQEKLINLFANNNVYMVGDVKQSIYRFRDANPEIFKKKYEKLKNSPPNLVIDLSKNFRSRKEVLTNVNKIFEQLMSFRIGGVKYDGSHILNYGFELYDGMNEENYEMRIATYSSKMLRENFSMFTNVECEAFFIATDIKKRVGKMKIFDKKTKEYRLLKYDDIAILVSGKKSMPQYALIFSYFGIPLNQIYEVRIDMNNVFYTFSNCLKVINLFVDNDQLILAPLIGLLRSYLVCATDDKIGEIMEAENVMEGFKNVFPDVYEKCYNIAKVIPQLSLIEIVDLIFEKFNFYERLLVLKKPSEAEILYFQIQKIINNLMHLDYSFNDVISYFDNIIYNKELEIKIKNEKNTTNAVHMMTIHASKGLEFPICYFPELYKRFNYSDINDRITYNNKYHLIMPYDYKNVLKKSISKILFEQKFKEEEVSEKIRLLYVALTRPREQMILVLPSEEEEKKFVLLESLKLKFTSFKSMIDVLLPSFEETLEKIQIESLNLTKDYTAVINKEVGNGVAFKFNFQEIIANGQQIEYQTPTQKEYHPFTLKELQEMNVGVVFHKLLEFTDLKNPDFSNLHEKEKNLIMNFLNQDIIKKSKIINYYHEYHFIFEKNNVVVNGIIDLLIEAIDKFIIIDYKLSNVEKNEYISQLSVYKNYVKSINEKPVETYLYSILKNEIKKV